MIKLKKTLLNLRKNFSVQLRVIWALIIREMNTRYGRENIGFLWVIGEPILFCAGVSIVWTAIRPAQEHGLDMTPMVITGYVPLTIWRHCISRAVKAFEANGSLFYHRQVTPLDVITARSFLEIIGTYAAGLIIVFFAMATGYMRAPHDLFPIIIGMLFQSIFSYGAALIVASLSEMSDFLEKFVTIFMYLSLPLTGAFIMVSWLPPQYQWILLLSPLANNTEMIRSGFFGLHAPAKYNLDYDISATVICLLLGLFLSSKVRRFIKLNG